MRKKKRQRAQTFFKKEVPIFNRLTAVFGCLMLVSFILLSRLFVLSIMDHPALDKMAKRQFENQVLIRPKRGLILDRAFNPLALNVPSVSLAANTKKLDLSSATIHELAEFLKIDERSLVFKLSQAKDFVWIKRHVSQEEYQFLNSWEDHQDGWIWVNEAKRFHPSWIFSGSYFGNDQY